MSDSHHQDTTDRRAHGASQSRARSSFSRRNALELERKRRQARRRKTITATVLCTLALIACIGVVGVASTMQSSSSPDTTQDAPASTGETTTQAESAVVSDTVAPTTAASSDTTDRSDFAVDPTKTDWNMHSTEEKIVYLTFDDGPSYNTQKVLDILDSHGCKATFFVTDINPEYEGMIKTCYDDGMTIGLHTYSHDYAKVYASADAYYDDLGQIGQLVADQIGYVPCFIRFPGGSSNTVSAKYTDGIMSFLSQDVITRGYQYWDWNLSCGDGAEHTADELVYYATEDDPEASNFTNIVMLMHDADGKDTTVEALPRIIEYYQAKGYTFKALDRSSFVSHQGINN